MSDFFAIYDEASGRYIPVPSEYLPPDVVKNTLQSRTASDIVLTSTPVSPLEAALKAQLKQWESAKRHAERQIQAIKDDLKKLA